MFREGRVHLNQSNESLDNRFNMGGLAYDHLLGFNLNTEIKKVLCLFKDIIAETSLLSKSGQAVITTTTSNANGQGHP